MTRNMTLAAILIAMPACVAEVEVPDADCSAEPIQSPSAARIEVVAGLNGFGFALHDRLSDEENTVVSPLSIAAALNMAAAGARGQTLMEMEEVLGIRLDSEEHHGELGALLVELLRTEWCGFDLHGGSAMFGRAGEVWEPAYLGVLEDAYRAPLTEVDFAAGDGEVLINDWVSERTEGLIPDLLDPGTLSPSTALVLANALYFQGSWEMEFEVEGTTDMPFVTPDGTVDVPTMHQQEELAYFENDLVRVVELPYVGGQLVMDVIVPVAEDGLAAVDAALAAGLMDEVVDGLGIGDVMVLMPRFEIRDRPELEPVLEEMGMPTAFTAAADFSGIRSSGGLMIDAVIHEAVIAVDESGTEAAAATAVVITDSASEVFELRANHPFTYVIRDQISGTVVFLGHVTDPS